jgi:hypothetical protein
VLLGGRTELGTPQVVFRSEGVRIAKTPVRAPKANAVAGRVVNTVRGECLDWPLTLDRRHFDRGLRVHVDDYSRERPHRALELRPPELDQRRERPLAGGILPSRPAWRPHPRARPRRRLWRDTDNGALQADQPLKALPPAAV